MSGNLKKYKLSAHELVEIIEPIDPMNSIMEEVQTEYGRILSNKRLMIQKGELDVLVGSSITTCNRKIGHYQWGVTHLKWGDALRISCFISKTQKQMVHNLYMLGYPVNFFLKTKREDVRTMFDSLILTYRDDEWKNTISRMRCFDERIKDIEASTNK